MEQMEEFNNLEENEFKSDRFPKLAKIIIMILSLIIFLLIIVVILSIVLRDNKKQYAEKKEEEEEKEKEKEKEMNTEEIVNFLRKVFAGDIYYNLTYASETVENTFKLNGKNYRKEIGEINENQDYKAHNLNQYDLYLPYSSLREKKSKGIILFIHGGAWIQGVKEEMNYL